MRNRSLTVLWLIVFAFQAAGLTHALHLALEDHVGHACCEHESTGGVWHTHDKSDSGLPSLNKPAPPSHDPAHCAVCQALAAFKPLHTIRPLLIVRLEPLRMILPAVDHPYLSFIHISTLGPRAPPSDRLRASV